MEDNKTSYEDALKELEDIVERLEKDDTTLSDSVEIFKKGVELYKYCNNLLSSAEGEVKLILKDSNDSLIEANFFEEVEEDNF